MPPREKTAQNAAVGRGKPDEEGSRHLEQRDRRVLKIEDFTDADMARIDAAKVPAHHTHLDEELDGWKP